MVECTIKIVGCDFNAGMQFRSRHFIVTVWLIMLLFDEYLIIKNCRILICFTNTSINHGSGGGRDDRGSGGEGGDCGCRGSEDGGIGGVSSGGSGGDSGVEVEFKYHFFSSVNSFCCSCCCSMSVGKLEKAEF